MRAIYKITDTVKLGLYSIRVHLVRSLLTILSVLFAVWSVIAMLSINEGLAKASREAVERLGSDNIIIDSVRPPEGATNASAAANPWEVSVYGLTYQDVARFRRILPGLRRCIVVQKRSKEAVVGAVKERVTVLATEPGYLAAARLQLADGNSRFITGPDVLRSTNVCVITSGLARKLFTYHDPVGRQVRLGTEAFTVVGVVTRAAWLKSAETAVTSESNLAFIPLPTCEQRFGAFNVETGTGQLSRERVEVSQVILQMVDEQAVMAAARILRSLLPRFHKENDYEMLVPQELIEQMKEQSRLWNIMFFGIASVSLLVGGIGIMNIMLASVTERTREIGIRRALGAKRGDIITQFLVEAVSLTCIGGLLGIMIGAIAVPVVMEPVLKLRPIIQPITLIVPLVMAVAVGLASGIYPAMRAARLDPIQALRHD